MTTKKLLLTFALTALILIAFATFIQLPIPKANASSIVLIDSYTEGNYSAGIVVNGLHPSATSKTVYGQSFTNLASNYFLTNATFYLKKAIGSPTGIMFAKLHAHTGTYGSSSTPTGEPLATSEGISLATLTTSYALYTFNFNASQQYEMQANQQYCISVGYVASGTVDITHSYNIGEDNSSPSHSGNSFYYLTDHFDYDVTIDTIFYVYGEIASSTTNTIDTTSNLGTVTFYINGTQDTTPNSTTLANGVYNFTAPQYFYSTATYNFSRWLLNTTATYTTRTIMPNITADTTFLLTYELAEWSNNTASIAGLSSTILDSLPANPVYNLRGDNKWVLISGSYSSTFYGWYWSGTLWIPDSTLVTGLYNDTFVWTTPTIAYNLRNDGKWVLISGDFYGAFHGWYWDGGPWIVDQTLVSGLGDIGSYSSPSIAYNLTGDAKWTLIAGKDTGTFSGFYWDGTTWVSNSTLISGLGDVGAYSMPTTALNVRGDNKAILISGERYGDYYGFYWNGTGWTSDTSIVDGLETFKLFSAPAMAFNIYEDNRWVLISGREDADWKGWENKNVIPITEPVTKPDIPQFIPPVIPPNQPPTEQPPTSDISIPGGRPFAIEYFPWSFLLFLLLILLVVASAYKKNSKIKETRASWSASRQQNSKRSINWHKKKKVKTEWNREGAWD